MNINPANDIALLNALIEGFGLSNDKQLADFLGITRTTIHNVRHARARLGIIQRLKVLDRIGFLKARRLLESIAPDQLSKTIEKSSHALARRHARLNAEKDKTTDDAILLELTKEAFGFKTDAELATFLGVARNTISMVRSGRSSLGPKPRLRILQQVEPFDLDSVEKLLGSAELLAKKVEAWHVTKISGDRQNNLSRK